MRHCVALDFHLVLDEYRHDTPHLICITLHMNFVGLVTELGILQSSKHWCREVYGCNI